jgi:hypothetical protein
MLRRTREISSRLAFVLEDEAVIVPQIRDCWAYYRTDGLFGHDTRMTQVALATRLQLDDWDIARSGVAKIEIGLRQVTDIEAEKLAKALDVSIAWLFGEE